MFEWATKNWRRAGIIFGSAAVGGGIILLSFLLFRGRENLFPLLNLIGALVGIGPFLFVRYSIFRKRGEIAERFPSFLRDIVEEVRAGMSLPRAIKETTDNDYGALTPYVKKMAAQLDWGVPFEEVLRKFADETGSKAIKRSISTIVETHRAGGNIGDVLKAVGEASMTIERLKKDRRSALYSQMITGYVIFFVFLGVMIGLQGFLLPALAGGGPLGKMGGGGKAAEMVGGEAAKIGKVGFKSIFQNLILIQGVFSGLAIGKMAKGTVIAGVKHAFILGVIGYTAWLIFI